MVLQGRASTSVPADNRKRPDVPRGVHPIVGHAYSRGYIAHLTQECLQTADQQRRGIYTTEQTNQAWSDAAEMVRGYSDEMIERWNKEIDTYLVFVSL